MKTKFIYLFLFFTLFIAICTKAQLVSITPAEEVIVKSALKDELSRSRDFLAGPEFERPFFIAYTLLWGQEYKCMAKMGTIYYNRTDPGREGTIRLMIGDYTLNDENFQDSRSSYSQASAFRQLSMLPQEVDYWAIRRYFWQLSDETFRSANDHYKHKLEAMKRQGITKESYQPADYSPATPVVDLLPPITLDINKNQISEMLCKVSNAFSNDTLFVDSEVSFSAKNYITYYINTEGTDIHYPHAAVDLNLSASMFDKHGNIISEQLRFNGLSMSDLPPENDLLEACKLIKSLLLLKRNTDTIPEDYSGPVLYEGVATAEYFNRYFFEGNNSLVATRESLEDEPDRQAVKENQSDLQKYNKRLFNRDLTVMDCPSLKEYNGIKLYGSYSVDAEGIHPPDTLILVENGVLKNMLNDRVPTKNQPQPNGHSRFGGFSVFQQVVPGVLVVTSSAPKTRQELKSMLLKEADDRNLEVAMIIRPCYVGKYYCGDHYYLVNVKDQSEKLIQADVMPADSYQQTRQVRILGCSDNLQLRNDFYSYSSEYPVSYILPDTVLVDEAEFSFNGNAGYGSKPRLVPYPRVNREK
jgi:hypothetical protein